MSTPETTATGPKTEEGKQRSSLNATKHGFTGQTLVLTPAEAVAYEIHVKGFYAEYSPAGQLEISLVQQLADLHWSLHQISVQQFNMISLINAISAQLAAEGNPLATASALTVHIKSLNTLNLYDQRRRRAVREVEETLKSVQKEHLEADRKELTDAADMYKVFKANGKPWVPADSGFVCSLADVEAFLEGQSLAAQFKMAQNPVSVAPPMKSIQEWIAEKEADLARTEAQIAEMEKR